MTEEQFDKFLDDHTELEHALSEDSDHILFKDKTWPWYQKEENYTSISKAKFNAMTPEELESAIYDGLKVEGITRITGYFTKLSSWNLGKKGELKDRRKCDEGFKVIPRTS